MKRFLGIVIVIAFAVITSSAIDCSNDTCQENGQQHTMCKYPSSIPAEACGEVLSVGLTEEEQREIVQAHNEHRSFVANGFEKRGSPGPQPPASNMQILVWDNELAEIAQRWAIQCTRTDDGCPHVDRFPVGQNGINIRSDEGFTITPSQLLGFWYYDVEEMDRNQVSRLTNNHRVNSYIQLVWAKTNRVGCGQIIYLRDGKKTYSMICNYGPKGNVFNESVYEIDIQQNNLKNIVSIDMN